MREQNSSRLGITGTVMILLGSLMFGIIAARAISEYQKDHFVLDEVEVHSPQPTGVFTTFLDLSGPDSSTSEVTDEETLNEVQSHVEEKYVGDNGEMELYFSHMPKHISIPAIDLNEEVGFATL